jgi:hypothetical protein
VKSIFDLVKRVESRVAKAMGAGANDSGQLGTSSVTNAGVATPEEISALKQKLQPVSISCGYRHAAGITLGDSLMVWGDGAGAQLGVDESLKRSTRPHLVLPLRSRRVLAVACGGSHTLAVVIDAAPDPSPTVNLGPLAPGRVAGSVSGGGALYAWGSSDVGALGLGPDVRVSWKPSPVVFDSASGCSGGGVTYISAGLVSSAAVCGQQLFVWGDASNGRLGLPRPATTSGPPGSVSQLADPVSSPTQLSLLCDIDRPSEVLAPIAVACGGSFTAFVGTPSSLVLSDGSGTSMSSISGGVLLVTGALGYQCRVVDTPLSGASQSAVARDRQYGAVSVALAPVPVARVEVPSAGEATLLDRPKIFYKPALTTTLGDRQCVTALSAGTSHLLVVVREGVEAKPLAAAAIRMRLAAASTTAAAAASASCSSSSQKYRGRVYSAGYSFLGHDCPADLRLQVREREEASLALSGENISSTGISNKAHLV